MPLAELRPHLHALPSIPTGSRTARRTTRGPGGSASRSEQLDALEDGDVRGRHRQHARAGLADVRRVLPAGRARRRGPADDARLPPVARERQPLRHRAADRARRAARRTRRARSRTGSSSSRGRSARSPGSPGTRTASRGSSAGLVLACVGDAAPLTYKRSRRGDAAVDRAAAAYVLRARTAGQSRRLRPLGLGRAPVQLAGLRPPGRLPEPLARGRVRGVPLVGGRPRARPARVARGGVCEPSSRSSTCSRPTAVREPRPEGRAAARQAGPLPDRWAAPAAEEEQLAMLWVLNQSDGGTRCSTSPSARGSRSRAIRDAAKLARRPGLLAESGERST